jgi:uncharacterized protein (DUF433 family)
MTLIAARISVDPLIRFGKPVIEGTRVPVRAKVGAVAAGDSWEDRAIRHFSRTPRSIHCPSPAPRGQPQK